MKKWLIGILASTFLALGGCSMLEGANDALTYVNEATDYVQEAKTFAEEAPELAQQAITDSKAAAEFETKLEDMKGEIESFNELNAPELAADLHNQVLEQNEKALDGINTYLENIEGGKLDPAALENTELFQSIQDISSIVKQIEDLGL